MVLMTSSMPAKASEELPVGECRLDEQKRGYFHNFSREELIAKYGFVPKQSKYFKPGVDDVHVPKPSDPVQKPVEVKDAPAVQPAVAKKQRKAKSTGLKAFVDELKR